MLCNMPNSKQLDTFFGGTRTLRHALEPSHWTQRTWSLLLGFRSLPPNAGPGQRIPHQLTLNCNLVFAATCLFSPPVLPTHPLTQHFHLDKSNVRAVPRQRMCDQGRGGDTHPHRPPPRIGERPGKTGAKCAPPVPTPRPLFAGRFAGHMASTSLPPSAAANMVTIDAEEGRDERNHHHDQTSHTLRCS